MNNLKLINRLYNHGPQGHEAIDYLWDETRNTGFAWSAKEGVKLGSFRTKDELSAAFTKHQLLIAG